MQLLSPLVLTVLELYLHCLFSSLDLFGDGTGLKSRFTPRTMTAVKNRLF